MRARRSPVIARDDALAARQYALPLTDTVPVPMPVSVAATRVERLWFCIYLPNLPLEACGPGDDNRVVVEEQQGVHRVLLAGRKARAAGVLPGQSPNAALALLPGLEIEERDEVREQQVLELLATWLERFSSFVSIAGSPMCCCSRSRAACGCSVASGACGNRLPPASKHRGLRPRWRSRRRRWLLPG